MPATFEQILLNPTTRQATGGDLTARVGLAATLDADRERLAQLNDDHYNGLIDKVMWVQQRARVAERIEATPRPTRTVWRETPRTRSPCSAPRPTNSAISQ